MTKLRLTGNRTFPNRLVRTLRGETQAPAPIWLMRQAGRYLPEYQLLRRRAGDFLSLCYTPELAVEAMLQPIRRFDLDAAILFSDILVLPDALGVEVSFSDGHGPRLQPVRTLADIAVLRPDGIRNHLAPVFETIERAAEALPKEVTLIGFAGAPWTVACYMVEGQGSKDFAAVKLWAFRDPEGFQRLIDVLVEATVEYLIEQVRHGAEVIQLFDTWAGLLPAGAFERWCITPTRTVIERFKAVWPNIPVIGYPRGAGIMLGEFVEGVRADAVSIDSGVPPAWAARELQTRTVVQGNLDPILLVAGGATMVDQIQVILDALGRGPFIFNLGHGIPPDTPPKNIEMLVRTVRDWRP